MDLKYKGNSVWIDADYHDDTSYMSNFELEQWQVNEYKGMVETTEKCIGRRLTKQEAYTIHWLSSHDKSSIRNITNIIKEAYENGKV